MVEEGVLSMEPKPQAAFGFHQWPFLPLGSIGGRPGPMLAATELFDIVVSGVGGHAAMCATSVTRGAFFPHLIIHERRGCNGPQIK